jgi:hypothetical protein
MSAEAKQRPSCAMDCSGRLTTCKSSRSFLIEDGAVSFCPSGTVVSVTRHLVAAATVNEAQSVDDVPQECSYKCHTRPHA